MILVVDTDDGFTHTLIGIVSFTFADDRTPRVTWPADIDRDPKQPVEGVVVRTAALPAQTVDDLKALIRKSDSVTLGLSNRLRRTSDILHTTVTDLRRDDPAALADVTVLESKEAV